MSKHVIIIGVLLVLVLIMVILLLAFPNMLGRKKFISKEHGYSMIINTGVIEYKRILLDANSKVTMDIYAKVKYNKPEELSAVVNSALE